MNRNLEQDAASGAQVRAEDLFAGFIEHGDHAALEDLVARWHGAAYRVARCICRNEALAEEAVQDAFVKLLSRQARFVDRGPGSFHSWFLCLVTNCARMARRCERRAEARKHVDPQAYLRSKGLEPKPQAVCGAPGEWNGVLERTLESLEERWRTPVRMHFFAGMQQREVAQALGVSQQMVSRRIDQGLAALRRRLTGGPVAC